MSRTAAATASATSTGVSPRRDGARIDLGQQDQIAGEPGEVLAAARLELVTDSHNPLPLCDNTDRVSIPFDAGE